jgi:uncharacterized membrane protein YfcA
MAGFSLALYLAATFLGGVTNGIAGFALGLVVSGVWLHIISPAQTAILITGYGLVAQGYGIWQLRHSLEWRKTQPFVGGGAVGAPIGAFLITYVNPDHMRTGVAALLVVYSLYGLARPTFKPLNAGTPADVGIGMLNGLLGGLTGLAGVVVAIWCQMQGWPKDMQRTVFQPTLFVVIAMSAASLLAAGAANVETGKLYLLGLPMLVVGTWCGWQLYGKLDDKAFRKVILVLLLVSGLSLIVPFH